jgi:histidine triad (HIT) family protein
VVAGELPARVVVEDATTVAFLDATPAARGHTLVVPRRHVVDVWDADADVLADVARTAHRVAALLRDRLAPDGLTLRQNNGPASGQRVDHLHVHLVPRWHGDGNVGWPWPPPQDLDLDALLAQLR